MGAEDPLVEQLRPEQLGGERRAAHTDGTVDPGPEGGELLDRIVAADDPGVPPTGPVPGPGNSRCGY